MSVFYYQNQKFSITSNSINFQSLLLVKKRLNMAEKACMDRYWDFSSSVNFLSHLLVLVSHISFSKYQARMHLFSFELGASFFLTHNLEEKLFKITIKGSWKHANRNIIRKYSLLFSCTQNHSSFSPRYVWSQFVVRFQKKLSYSIKNNISSSYNEELAGVVITTPGKYAPGVVITTPV